MQDDYELLGVRPGATKRQIRQAWKKKAFELHPDRNQGNDAAFKELKHAYDRIIDGVPRQKKPEAARSWSSPPPPPPRPASRPRPKPTPRTAPPPSPEASSANTRTGYSRFFQGRYGAARTDKSRQAQEQREAQYEARMSRRAMQRNPWYEAEQAELEKRFGTLGVWTRKGVPKPGSGEGGEGSR